MTVSDFPHVNAALNALASVLLVTGYVMIRRRRIVPHATCMIAATVVSAAFLGFYLVYHYHTGHRSTAEMTWLPRWLRLVYLGILLPHLVLAIVMLPMILATFFRAATRAWDKHRRIARPTFWVWLFVSVTGVVIYAMLYHLFPAMQ